VRRFEKIPKTIRLDGDRGCEKEKKAVFLVIMISEIKRYLLLLTLLLPLFFTPLLSVAEGRSRSLNFWPLFQYGFDPDEGVTEINGLGPLFSLRKDSTRSEWGIRPLLFWTEDEAEALERLEFVYPFGKYQIKEGDKKGYLFPIARYRDQTSDEKRKWDFQFFPFFIGETEEGEDYNGIFPLFGTLLDRYGKEEIRFYFWPLYSESTSEGVRQTNVLWPFFTFIEGEKKKGYRFWPFYGRREEVGVSYSRFFLWPIFIKQKKGLDTENPIEERMVFPFYVSKESKSFESKTYLWPFFSHTINRSTGFEQWDLPWPIFRSLEGENLKGIRVFPFYGNKVKEGVQRRMFILYPIYQMEEDQTDDVHERTTRILLLGRIRSREDPKGLEKEHSVRIWPFFDYEKDETGYEKLFVFYLFPFKDEGLERNLFPLFRIFRWEKDHEKGISTNFLWGFYKRMKKEEVDSWEIAHLVGMRRGEGWKTISFLEGLFRYRSDEEKADLRLFYLPFHIRWSHHHPPDLSFEKPACPAGRGDDAVQRQGSLVEPGSANAEAIISVVNDRILAPGEEGGFKSFSEELANGQ
jgi:hypothetical protein